MLSTCYYFVRMLTYLGQHLGQQGQHLGQQIRSNLKTEHKNLA